MESLDAPSKENLAEENVCILQAAPPVTLGTRQLPTVCLGWGRENAFLNENQERSRSFSLEPHCELVHKDTETLTAWSPDHLGLGHERSHLLN